MLGSNEAPAGFLGVPALAVDPDNWNGISPVPPHSTTRRRCFAADPGASFARAEIGLGLRVSRHQRSRR